MTPKLALHVYKVFKIFPEIALFQKKILFFYLEIYGHRVERPTLKIAKVSRQALPTFTGSKQKGGAW